MAITAVLLVLTAITCYILYTKTHPPRCNLPPGPVPLPLLGNINDLPPKGTPEWSHWLRHKDLYGGISSVSVLGTTMILIHDKKIAHDLLTQQSSKTSGRPMMVMANKLCGYEQIVLCQNYTPSFRRARKFLHRELGTKISAAEFLGAQEVEVNRLLVRTLDNPERYLEHCITASGATVLKMAYGYTVEPHSPDRMVELSDKMMNEFSQAAVPGSWACDIIPALQHLPESFPGFTFKKIARQWKRSIQATAYIPYRFVQRQMTTATSSTGYQPSYVSKLISQLKAENNGILSSEDEQTIIWTAASLYGAAADTTVIALTAVTAAMILFPDVQRKAQEEIDRVVGPTRLPTFSDRENLPYINALVKEALRWWPIAPLSFPHTATEDIEYNGMHIPKDSILLPNVWWFMHNPDVYTNPDDFDPERFLAPRNEPDPETEIWGFGRRICAGRVFADASLYLNIVQPLAVFSFSKQVDEEGKEVEVDVRPKPGVLAYPTEFGVRVVPRGEQAVQLIREVEKKVPWEESHAGLLDSVDDFKIV